MLFKQAILERIGRGEVRLAYRRWPRPSVQPGTHLHTPVSRLAIEAVEEEGQIRAHRLIPNRECPP